MSKNSLDPALTRLFAIVPGLVGAEIARTRHAFPDGHVVGWTVRITVPRMGKSGQLLGRGVENLSGSGETVEEAVAEVVRFFGYRRSGQV